MKRIRNIVVKNLKESSIEKRDVEIVERKGTGHPDSLCDGVCETASRSLSEYYLKNFGYVLHHNLDKGLLVAGKSEPRFGGGKIVEPIKVIIAGRATDRVGRKRVPVEKIVKESTENYLASTLGFSKSEIRKIFRILIDYQPGADNLKEVIRRGKEIPVANDTSFGVSFAPFSRAERLTIEISRLLNSGAFIKRFPFIGRDTKVMTLREKECFSFTLAVAFVGRHIKSSKEYFEAKDNIKREIEKYLQNKFYLKRFKVEINTLDNPKAQSPSEIYLTYSGLSAEQGDDGQVGRGNRVNGLITPSRPMSLEAAAGKNISHPGKLYQILAFLIAQEISKIKTVNGCYVSLLSEIGKPLDLPQIALVELRSKNFYKVKEKAYLACQRYFEKLAIIQKEIIKGRYQLF